MPDLWVFALGAAAAYLLGSIPFGFLVARTRGIDIQSVGSGNIGATNVFRSVGKGAGVFTFACDFLKGLLPTLVLPLAFASSLSPSQVPVLRVTAGFLAIAGHNWPIFLRFKGGKGIATSAGALVGIAPAAIVCGLATWLAVCALTRYVSLASIAAAAVVAAAAWTLRFTVSPQNGLLVPVALTILAGVAVWRHHSNISRLLAGTEPTIR